MEVQCLLAFVFALLCTGCVEEMPLTARYVPADCAAESPFSGEPVRPAREQAEEEAVAPPAAPPPPGPVDLNAATAAELETLPGIGPAIAARIVEYRARRPFRRKSELMRVRGIGPATFRKLADAVTVTSPGSEAQKRAP